ncbi:hypothetical protein BC939DRAFT_503532 [Gamsiella multidivaricata]|uniref:uncharacterized protein n=1 Tax=Gamsiella multidivaricata TaxID=101098 RepID=UPI00221F79A0|nr:uncharacterized protein BC939DRAFT_503532 [Gamsiella multidivaricata]KAI7823065.1 hypothetical protein BC939DRAFT_503532 [Gamsiella multidivaricata]
MNNDNVNQAPLETNTPIIPLIDGSAMEVDEEFDNGSSPPSSDNGQKSPQVEEPLSNEDMLKKLHEKMELLVKREVYLARLLINTDEDDENTSLQENYDAAIRQMAAVDKKLGMLVRAMENVASLNSPRTPIVRGGPNNQSHQGNVRKYNKSPFALKINDDMPRFKAGDDPRTFLDNMKSKVSAYVGDDVFAQNKSALLK